MTIPKETLWPIEPHTLAKHTILKRYLGAWFPILKKYHNRIVYIDGFCGPGEYKGGEPGSPLIALDVAASHDLRLTGELLFWFIDERQDRIDLLNSILSQTSWPDNFKINVDCAEFHQVFGEVLDSLHDRKKSLAPTFAFLDPFGFSGIPYRIVAELLQHRHCEAFITFMVDSINRFLEHPDDMIYQHIVDAFGSEKVKIIARSGGNRIENLRKFYQLQLQKVARFVRYFEMRDQRNRPVYFLFFASNHEKGHVKMKEAMWSVDTSGDFSFSDATDPNQPVLFGDYKISQLSQILCARFSHLGLVTGEMVRLFVEDETAFLNKHKTEALKELEFTMKLEPVGEKINGKIRRAWTYPDESLMKFL